MKDIREILNERIMIHDKYAKLNLQWHDTIAHTIGFSILAFVGLALMIFVPATLQKIVNITTLVFSGLALLGQVISLSMRFGERHRFHTDQKARCSGLIEKLERKLIKEEDAIQEYEDIIRGDAEVPGL